MSEEQASTFPMGTVWKYAITGPITEHQIPQGAKAVHTGPDSTGAACVWFFVMPDQPLETRQIVLFGTGDEIPAVAVRDFVGTLIHGEFVSHVFVPSVAPPQ